MQSNQERLDFFLTVIRGYLNQNNYQFYEEVSSSGSCYFHITTPYSNGASVLRISDHNLPKNKAWCYTLLWNTGYNTSRYKLKHKIISTVKNVIKNSKKYSLQKLLEAL